MKKFIVVLLSVCMFSVSGYSYGPRGHGLVGAIADRRLSKNTTVAARVSELLDGLSLQQAATLPDEIKGWDRCGNKKSIKGPGSPVNASKRINTELRAFLNANLCSSNPSHHEFHYTDVPVFGHEKYGDGKTGRSDFDIVQMIPFCIRVLKGDEPETNSRAITKSIALILLVHYMGDIHQPLHVGAEFFDEGGNPSDHGFEDQGGNKLTLFTFKNGVLKNAGVFHSYWDGQTVSNAFGDIPDSTIAKQLASKEPANWRLTGPVEGWAEELANEILPMAREGHDRLEFSKIDSQRGDKEIKSGNAEEKKKLGGKFYAVWANELVKDEIHKGGWRLAALLEEMLK